MYNAVRVPGAALFAFLLSTFAALEPSAAANADAASIGSKPRDYMTRGPSGTLRSGTESSAGVDRKIVQAGVAGAASVTTTGTITNVPISTELYDQIAPLMIPDGGGGGIAVWCDLRGGGTSRDIYAQKLNGGGVAQWAMNGVPVCKASGSQDSARAVSDGAGGVLVVWQDSRGSSIDIYAQRINSMGVPLWQGGGLPVCVAANAQRQPVVVSDGLGGAVVAWVDERTGVSDVYAQRISAGGVAQWTVDGVAVCTASGVQQNPAIVTDGQRGAIVGWQDQRGAAGDIYARRVNEFGALQWTADGVAVCGASGTQETPVAVSDGAGGAILAWVDGRGANKDVYARRVDGSGAVQWTADGVGVCAAGGDQVTPVLSEDGEGGVVVTWQDGRGVDQDVYAQRVSNAGAAQWAANGVGLCAAVGDQTVPAIARDPLGGAVVAWTDLRTGGNGTDIFAQHVNPAGAVQWTANGVQVCDALNAQDGAVVVSDGVGGAGVAWRDVRGGAYSDVYGQWVDASGQVANQCTPPDTLPASVPVATVATQNYKYFNQGWFRWGGVGVRGSSGDWDIEVFDQGSAGQSPYPTCFGAPLAGSFGTSTVDFVVGDFNDLQTPPGLYGVRAYRYSGTGGAVIEWEGGPEVIAVDGAGVTGESNWTGLLDVWDVQMTAGINYWIELNHSPSADIKVLVFTSFGSPDYYYVVPRSARVAEGSGRYVTYLAPATDRYGLVVVNDNGVADQYTLKVWSTSQGVGVEPPRVLSTGLRGVAPNPSAGRVQIQFALHEPGAASFDVVDMAGRKVAQIPGQRWEAGTWSVEWDGRTSRGTQAAPGIYFVQMRVDERRVGLGRIALIR